MKLGLDYTVEINDSAITQDLQKFYSTFAKAATKEAANRIEKFAQIQMNGYYNEYDPEYYERTMQMHDHSYQKFNMNSGNIYEGGIFTNSSFTFHESVDDNFTEEDIYTNVWEKGIHGWKVVLSRSGSETVVIQGKPDRFGDIEKEVQKTSFQNEMFRIGVNAAMKEKYSVLRFS